MDHAVLSIVSIMLAHLPVFKGFTGRFIGFYGEDTPLRWWKIHNEDSFSQHIYCLQLFLIVWWSKRSLYVLFKLWVGVCWKISLFTMLTLHIEIQKLCLLWMTKREDRMKSCLLERGKKRKLVEFRGWHLYMFWCIHNFTLETTYSELLMETEEKSNWWPAQTSVWG